MLKRTRLAMQVKTPELRNAHAEGLGGLGFRWVLGGFRVQALGAFRV